MPALGRRDVVDRLAGDRRRGAVDGAERRPGSARRDGPRPRSSAGGIPNRGRARSAASKRTVISAVGNLVPAPPRRAGSCRHSRSRRRTADRAAPRQRTADHAGDDRRRAAPRSPLRRLCGRPAAAIRYAPHPHDGEDVEQRHQRHQHGKQRAVAARGSSSPGRRSPVTITASPAPASGVVDQQAGEDQEQVEQREARTSAARCGRSSSRQTRTARAGEDRAQHQRADAVEPARRPRAATAPARPATAPACRAASAAWFRARPATTGSIGTPAAA